MFHDRCVNGKRTSSSTCGSTRIVNLWFYADRQTTVLRFQRLMFYVAHLPKFNIYGHSDTCHLKVSSRELHRAGLIDLNSGELRMGPESLVSSVRAQNRLASSIRAQLEQNTQNLFDEVRSLCLRSGDGPFAT